MLESPDKKSRVGIFYAGSQICANCHYFFVAKLLHALFLFTIFMHFGACVGVCIDTC